MHKNIKIKVSLLILSLFFNGCTKSDFELKQMCSQYIDKYQNIVDDEMEWRQAPPNDIWVQLKGVFYSKKHNTCIAIIERTYKFGIDGEGPDTVQNYFDALTGNSIDTSQYFKNVEFRDIDEQYTHIFDDLDLIE